MKPLVRINCTTYDPAKWSKWDIIANEVIAVHGIRTKLGDLSIHALGQFLENSDRIISRQLRAMNSSLTRRK